MTEDEDYDEFEAVVRVPKGERLADSKKTEGWSRGFTPKSADKGPEHVEIRLKDEEDDVESDPTADEPQSSHTYDYGEPQRQKTPEQEALEEELAQLLGALIMLGMLKAAEWAQPRMRRLWNERLIPFLNTPRRRWQERRAQRKVHEQSTAEAPETVSHAMLVGETSKISNALEAYKANMSSSEARRHFTEALIAQRFADAKMRLLANARIEDDEMSELARAVQALTPKQVEVVLESILASNPTLLEGLGKLIESSRNDGALQLGSDGMKAALRLTDGR